MRSQPCPQTTHSWARSPCSRSNFAPTGWASCDGQILPLSQNTALFALLGTTYGGNGTSNFALPNLNGRAPLHPGEGPGLSPRLAGEQGGSETVTLLATEMPAHAHGRQATPDAATSYSPAMALPATSDVELYGPVPAAQATTTPAGGSQPHNNMQPYLVLGYHICLQGIFPPRS